MTWSPITSGPTEERFICMCAHDKSGKQEARTGSRGMVGTFTAYCSATAVNMPTCSFQFWTSCHIILFTSLIRSIARPAKRRHG